MECEESKKSIKNLSQCSATAKMVEKPMHSRNILAESFENSSIMPKVIVQYIPIEPQDKHQEEMTVMPTFATSPALELVLSPATRNNKQYVPIKPQGEPQEKTALAPINSTSPELSLKCEENAKNITSRKKNLLRHSDSSQNVKRCLSPKKRRTREPENSSPVPRDKEAHEYIPMELQNKLHKEPQEEAPRVLTPASPPSPALFLEYGESNTKSPTRSLISQTRRLCNSRRRRRKNSKDKAILEGLNYGSESDHSSNEDEELSPIPPMYQGAMDTSLYEEEASETSAAPVVDVRHEPPVETLASDSEGAVRPNDFFHFEWRQFPIHIIPSTERREPFTQFGVGPAELCQDPYTIFVSIWDTQIMQHIVKETNKYAQEVKSQRQKNNNLGRKSRIRYWKDTCIDELYTYFAIVLAMGIVIKSKLEEYWATDCEIFTTPGFRVYMNLSRFQQLNACLHFNENESMCKWELSTSEANIFRIEPLISHLNAKFQSMYTISQNIVLNESLMQWEGGLSRDKAAKIGIRTYELCESQTGYLYKFDVHAKKHISQTSQVKQTPLDSSTTAIILDLLRGLEGKGYTVWMGNLYNSPALARKLKVLGFDVAGTFQTNRQFVPREISDLIKTNMQREQIIGFTSGDVDLIVWLDKNPIAAISTYHSDNTGVWNNKKIPCVILDYNTILGGVSKKDKLLSMYPIERKKTRVWHQKFFRKMLNVTVLNSYVIAKKSGSSVQHHNFRMKLIQSLLRLHKTTKNMPPSTKESVFLAKIHHLLEYPVGTNKSRLRRKCSVCKKLTHFYCAGCEKTVCISTCFVTLHS